eukprot:Clim_evm94s108 gene=Clim_evmTU94s108
MAGRYGRKLLDLVESVNPIGLKYTRDALAKEYHFFMVAGKEFGTVQREVVQELSESQIFKQTFHVAEDRVELDPSNVMSVKERSEKVATLLNHLRREVTEERKYRNTPLCALLGWRDELYPVNSTYGAEPYLLMERSATGIFGIEKYGVHINGWLTDPEKGIMMWLGRRALDKPTYPGMLDQMAAGGLPVGLGVMENLIKECYEEAGIAEELASKAVPVGTVSYQNRNERGVHPEIQFVYDLEMPADFVPHNTDGEVCEFILEPIHNVLERICKGEVKGNSGLVIIDFCVRRGVLNPDDEPHYCNIVTAMHTGWNQLASASGPREKNLNGDHGS